MALARRWTRRLLRASLYALVAVLLLSAILRTATYLYRLRAEHLMADLQSLQLRHSTWPEAQRLITRWGRHGHYEGTCDASFCRYTISLESPEWAEEYTFARTQHSKAVDSIGPPTHNLLQRLGSRAALIDVTFVVQDGVILRKGAVFAYSVVNNVRVDDSYLLIATIHSASRLGNDDGWYLTGTDQLARHPFYTFTRPGGCTFCMMARVTFAADTPDSQVRNLTTFDLACLTSFRPCTAIEDVYPASEGWHLYDGATGGRPETIETQKQNAPLPVACGVPIFARGREAGQIFAVTSITESQHTEEGVIREPANLRLDEVLKGSTFHRLGERMSVVAEADGRSTPLQIETPLTPSKHFLIISFYPADTSYPLELNRCSVIPDTPENRAQLQLGIAQNDTLRHSDPRADWFVPE
ncbi:hypothetical protein [Granulicella aggregans]|uniref:hypothetical protein n=1 Tax=Granulicella aggregans TaxID=474949 RepID=UPI0021E0D769|nr:hypothetical protein [Granulicella aggregans]